MEISITQLVFKLEKGTIYFRNPPVILASCIALPLSKPPYNSFEHLALSTKKVISIIHPNIWMTVLFEFISYSKNGTLSETISISFCEKLV